MSTFDANDYSTIPTRSATRSLTLVRRLIAEMPSAISRNPLTQAPAERMRDRAETLRKARLMELEITQEVNARPFDWNEDNAWGALHGRLAAATRLRLEANADRAARAAELVSQIFPNGLRFLTLSYKEQWEESDRLLQLIEANRLMSSIDDLAGPEYLAELREVHAQYGEALGLTLPKPEARPHAQVADALTALHEAMRFYTRRVLALADEEDPSSIELVQRTLAPFVEAQAEERANRAEAPAEPSDDAAIPELPS